MANCTLMGIANSGNRKTRQAERRDRSSPEIPIPLAPPAQPSVDVRAQRRACDWSGVWPLSTVARMRNCSASPQRNARCRRSLDRCLKNPALCANRRHRVEAGLNWVSDLCGTQLPDRLRHLHCVRRADTTTHRVERPRSAPRTNDKPCPSGAGSGEAMQVRRGPGRWCARTHKVFGRHVRAAAAPVQAQLDCPRPSATACPLCHSLTDDPDRHRQWHCSQADNLQSLLDTVAALKPPSTSHRR